MNVLQKANEITDQTAAIELPKQLSFLAFLCELSLFSTAYRKRYPTIDKALQ